MKRICKNCGNVVKGKGKFCDKCGAELVDEMPVIEEDRTQPVNEIPAAEDANAQPVGEISAAPEGNSKQKKKRRWLIPLIIVIVVAAVSGAVLLFKHTGNPYKEILGAAQKTLRTQTSFTISSSKSNAYESRDSNSYGYLDIDANEGTVYMYLLSDKSDDTVTLNYKYGGGTISYADSSEPLSKPLAFMCEDLLSFTKSGDTEVLYDWLLNTNWMYSYFNLYGTDFNAFADAGHELYQELSTEDSLNQIMHYEKTKNGKTTYYTFSPDMQALFDETCTVLKPLYSDKEQYNSDVDRFTSEFDDHPIIGEAEFRVDSDGYLRVIDMRIITLGDIVPSTNSVTITLDRYEE